MPSSFVNLLDKNINYEKIDEDFVIVKFYSKQKGIFVNSYILDGPELNFLSVCYGYGKYAFALMDKEAYKEMYDHDFNHEIEWVKIPSKDADHFGTLEQLFINAIANREEDYNNVTGQLFRHIKTYGNSLKVLQFNIKEENGLYLNCSVANFVRLVGHTDYHKPIFEFCSDDKSLKRVKEVEKNKIYYIKQGIKNRKSSYNFLNLKDGNGRASEMFHILEKVNHIFGDYINLNFVKKEIIQSLNLSDILIKDIIFSEISNHKFNFIDLVNDDQYKSYIKDFIHYMDNEFGIQMKSHKRIYEDCINIAFIHDEEYYLENKINDPHKEFDKKCVVQCVTPETIKNLINNDDATPQLNTILKECLLKENVLKGNKISLVDWRVYNFESDWTFIYKFPKKKGELNDIYYSMIIRKDGTFKINRIEENIFTNGLLNKYRDIFENDDIEFVIEDDKGNINSLKRTDIITLPSETCIDKEMSRSKKFVDENLSGLININYYNINNSFYYNVGTDLKSCRQVIHNASHLYKVNLIGNSKNIIKDILRLMTVSFVKYNNLTALPFPIKMIKEYANIDLREYL